MRGLEKRLLKNVLGEMEGEDAEGRRKEIIFFLSLNTKVKGKVIPLQARCGPKGG